MTHLGGVLISNKFAKFKNIKIAKNLLKVNKAFPLNAMLDAVLCGFLWYFVTSST